MDSAAASSIRGLSPNSVGCYECVSPVLYCPGCPLYRTVQAVSNTQIFRLSSVFDSSGCPLYWPAQYVPCVELLRVSSLFDCSCCPLYSPAQCVPYSGCLLPPASCPSLRIPHDPVLNECFRKDGCIFNFWCWLQYKYMYLPWAWRANYFNLNVFDLSIYFMLFLIQLIMGLKSNLLVNSVHLVEAWADTCISRVDTG